jgi:hypothetical protein
MNMMGKPLLTELLSYIFRGNPEKLTFGEYRHSTEGSCELDSGNLSSIIMKLAQDVVDETGVLSGPIWYVLKSSFCCTYTSLW